LLDRMADGSERIFVFYGWNHGSHYPPGANTDTDGHDALTPKPQNPKTPKPH